MSEYRSGTSRNTESKSDGPPSYEDFQNERQSISSAGARDKRNEPRYDSIRSNATSTSSEPMKMSGLSYAFTSTTLPKSTTPTTRDDVPILPDGAEEIYPLGADRYKSQQTDEEGGLDLTKLDPRDAWGNKMEFILASVGLAVGLGNIWRFPYLCQKNGGGAFLIPYFIMMVIEGIPLFLIEFALGQRFRRSSVGAWLRIHPALQGIGISCIFISMIACIYYVSVIAWSFYYLFISLTSQLPWRIENCPGYDGFKPYLDRCKANSSDCKGKETYSECCVHDAPLYYFYRKVLRITSHIEDTGGINGELFGCLLLSWVVVCACIIKGVKSSGKAVYFTATFPYVILTILFFVGVTLDGAGEGLKTLFYPDFSRLKEPGIWMDAATQMFFTLSLGFGALISFASYMPIKNNCIRDAYIVVFINCGTSIFAGIVVFSILGHRELKTKSKASEVGSGPGLAFITFCDAFLQMPVSPLWSFLFFMMLILLGIDSEFGTLEGFIAPFYDMKWVKIKKEFFTIGVGAVMCLIGLALVSSTGYYAFQMFDDFSMGLPLLFIAFFQTIAISWVYGNENFANDIEYMTGSRPNIFWMFCWKYLSPLAILIIFLTNCVKLGSNPPKYDAYVGCTQQLLDFSTKHAGTKTSLAKLDYPGWAKFFIFVFTVISMIPIIVFLVKDLVKNRTLWARGFRQRFSNLYSYHPDPALVDKSRYKTGRDIEEEIKKELQEELQLDEL